MQAIQSVDAGKAGVSTALQVSKAVAGAPLDAAELQAQYRIIRRNGAVVPFEPSKITVAMTKAFLAVSGGQGAASARIREVVAALTEAVVGALVRRQPAGGTFHIEDVQDQVELSLMRSGEHEVARAYVLYRQKRSEERARAKERAAPVVSSALMITDDAGNKVPLDVARLQDLLDAACDGLTEARSDLILESSLKN